MRTGVTHGGGNLRPPPEPSALPVSRPVLSITYAALEQRNLKLSCRSCEHVRVLHCAALVFLFERRGWDDRLPALPARFWCSQCRLLSGRKVKNPLCAFVDEDQTGAPLALPDERNWKAFTRRFRS